ncbi:MAG: sugar kinase [Eubacterium sp.]|nr:sugar kinase [Eubacterium sp.]
MGRGMNKVIIIKRRTRLEDLKKRYNTIEQAKFYIEHLGADFTDYKLEHENYYASLNLVRIIATRYARVQEVDRDYISSMIFGKDDVVIAVGQDGLVANVMKYLNGQPLIGVNPDIKRWDGKLLNFEAIDMERVLPRIFDGNFSEKHITMAKATTRDGQVLYAVNDIFLGVNNHTSARYTINYNEICENQSSSGVIISTGFGMTGWHRSIMAEFAGMAKAFNLGNFKIPEYAWDSKALTFHVREPYPSIFTEADLVYGTVTEKDNLSFVSNMGENGVLFSDGITDDAIDFTAGMEIKVAIAERFGRLVMN